MKKVFAKKTAGIRPAIKVPLKQVNEVNEYGEY
jgi:hypothetical protein